MCTVQTARVCLCVCAAAAAPSVASAAGRGKTAADKITREPPPPRAAIAPSIQKTVRTVFRWVGSAAAAVSGDAKQSAAAVKTGFCRCVHCAAAGADARRRLGGGGGGFASDGSFQ